MKNPIVRKMSRSKTKVIVIVFGLFFLWTLLPHSLPRNFICYLIVRFDTPLSYWAAKKLGAAGSGYFLCACVELGGEARRNAMTIGIDTFYQMNPDDDKLANRILNIYLKDEEIDDFNIVNMIYNPKRRHHFNITEKLVELYIRLTPDRQRIARELILQGTFKDVLFFQKETCQNYKNDIEYKSRREQESRERMRTRQKSGERN